MPDIPSPNHRSSVICNFLFPEIEPYDSGYMSIAGTTHEIYYEQCGNPDGYPILFIHGGPGSGCSENDRRFFNPDKWRIILFDQRGCGRSKYYNNIYANNTWSLVDDIRTLYKRLGINKAMLFGGSWGSTLATVFAIEYPRYVSGLVLRGIFLGTKREIDYFYKDGLNGVGVYIPDEWEKYISNVPYEYKDNPLAFYYEKIKAGDINMARELSIYEGANLHLYPPTKEDLEDDLKSPLAIALLEAYYFIHDCFLTENYILDNAHLIPKDIPISIIQGKYDLVCMPLSAKLLHERISQSTLHWTVAGHSSKDPETLKMLISETEIMYEKVKPKTCN